jgi:hypothetical protein
MPHSLGRKGSVDISSLKFEYLVETMWSYRIVPENNYKTKHSNRETEQVTGKSFQFRTRLRR